MTIKERRRTGRKGEMDELNCRENIDNGLEDQRKVLKTELSETVFGEKQKIHQDDPPVHHTTGQNRGIKFGIASSRTLGLFNFSNLPFLNKLLEGKRFTIKPFDSLERYKNLRELKYLPTTKRWSLCLMVILRSSRQCIELKVNCVEKKRYFFPNFFCFLCSVGFFWDYPPI